MGKTNEPYKGKLVIEGDGWVHSSSRLICSPYLTAMQLRMYLVLKTFGGYDKVFPSLVALSKRCNASKPTVIKAINDLQDLSLLEVVRERTLANGGSTSNEYILKDYNKWETKYRKKTGLPLLDMVQDEEEKDDE